jgi:hypothetical protein
MNTTATRPSRASRRTPLSNAVRALACTAALASVTLLTAGPAQARVETPQDTPGHAAPVDAGPTRVAGLYGIHVEGGWLLR